MGERKVLNKYYPPDFDPEKLPRLKRKANYQESIRMMLPFSLRCNYCGDYMGQGTKFNSRKETVEEEDYLGLRIFRFYMKCRNCAQEFTIKTDPKNADYVPEMNCQRLYTPYRELEKEAEEDEEGGPGTAEDDAIRALEKRTMESKRDMEIMDALDEQRALNARHLTIDADEILRRRNAKAQESQDDDGNKLTADEEQELRQIFTKDGTKRLVDDTGDSHGLVWDEETIRARAAARAAENAKAASTKARRASGQVAALRIQGTVVRKTPSAEKPAIAGIADYGSSSSGEE